MNYCTTGAIFLWIAWNQFFSVSALLQCRTHFFCIVHHIGRQPRNALYPYLWHNTHFSCISTLQILFEIKRVFIHIELLLEYIVNFETTAVLFLFWVQCNKCIALFLFGWYNYSSSWAAIIYYHSEWFIRFQVQLLAPYQCFVMIKIL